MLDVAFTVEGPWENLEDIPKEEIINGMLRRIHDLNRDPAWLEAFGVCDIYEVDEGMLKLNHETTI